MTKDKLIAGHYRREDLLADRHRYRTTSLFYETIPPTSSYTAIFNIKYDHDITKKGVKYISLKKLYMECYDPTEQLFVDQYLYDWGHWERLCNGGQLGPYIQSWRDELERRMVGEAIQAQIELAKNGNQNAAKWLATQGWKKQSTKTKKQKVREAVREKEAKEFDSFIKEDAERLGLTVQ